MRVVELGRPPYDGVERVGVPDGRDEDELGREEVGRDDVGREL